MVDAFFGPEKLRCLEHESPAVLTVSNVGPAHTEHEGPARIVSGGSWHTDIEYEPIPMHLSMFLVQRVPVVAPAARASVFEAAQEETGWACPSSDAPHPYYDGSSEELMRLRTALPVNGETAFADTTAAFADLGADEQAALEKVMVRRRLNEGDEGWLVSRCEHLSRL